MNETFRSYIDSLKEHDQISVISKLTDLRDVAALTAQSNKALLFTNLSGYSMPLASGLLQSRNRLALGMGTAYEKIEEKLRAAMDHPVEPALVSTAPVKEVVRTGDDVDLYDLPIPVFSIMDGGPMITDGGILAEDPEFA